jgi:hypothetical protein
LKGKKETTITHEGRVRILLAMACWRALANPHLPKTFQKIHVQIRITAVCPDPPNSTYGSCSPLGVKYLPNTLQYLHYLTLVYITIPLIYSNMLPYTLKLS